jgi:hypothetical protein
LAAVELQVFLLLVLRLLEHQEQQEIAVEQDKVEVVVDHHRMRILLEQLVVREVRVEVVEAVVAQAQAQRALVVPVEQADPAGSTSIRGDL